MKPEPAIFYNQARLPMVGIVYHHSHKTYDPQLVVPARYSETMIAENLRQ